MFLYIDEGQKLFLLVYVHSITIFNMSYKRYTHSVTYDCTLTVVRLV